jgi:NAD(P)-dependent dehydrogenase (short-subunit alcohol dehydrogenase family)
MLLTNKNAVNYGTGGAIGGAIARAFAREGAKVFLTGRRFASVDAVASDIFAAGGVAETAQVDALDELAVEKHLSAVVELSPESFVLPIMTYMKTHFLTTRTAARHMVEKKSGVILTLTATPARMAAPLVGDIANNP